MIRLGLAPEYDSIPEARRALHRELDRLARLRLDPAKVPGALLIDFNKQWPDPWIWSEERESCWIDAEEIGEQDGSVLSADETYDIRGFWLVEDGAGKSRPLISFVRDFLKAQDAEEDA